MRKNAALEAVIADMLNKKVNKATSTGKDILIRTQEIIDKAEAFKISTTSDEIVRIVNYIIDKNKIVHSIIGYKTKEGYVISVSATALINLATKVEKKIQNVARHREDVFRFLENYESIVQERLERNEYDDQRQKEMDIKMNEQISSLVQRHKRVLH